jgi:hypothetical protein
MNVALGSSGSYRIYSAICLCAFISLFSNCPETRGKSLKELESIFNTQRKNGKSLERISGYPYL